MKHSSVETFVLTIAITWEHLFFALQRTQYHNVGLNIDDRQPCELRPVSSAPVDRGVAVRFALLVLNGAMI